MGLTKEILRWWTMRRFSSVGRRVIVRGSVVVPGAGRVELRDDALLDARAACIELNAGPGATIVVGRGAMLESGVSIEAISRVEIGEFSRIRGFAKILDTHFHAIVGNRRSPSPAPGRVTVGAHCDVGWRTVLLPGAILEDGVRAGGNSVLTRRVPKNIVVGGAPPRRIQQDSPLVRTTDTLATVSGETLASRQSITFEEMRGSVRRGPLAMAQRLIARARMRWVLRGQDLGRNVSVRGKMLTDVRGHVKIGSNANFLAHVVSSQLVVHPRALLEIGDDFVCNYGVCIEAAEHIRIGHRCLIGSYVRLCDDDGLNRGPIVIEDDVWLAHGVIVEPGVTVGAGSVVSASAVVTKSVPPHSLVVGNPARAMSLALRSGAERY